MRFLLAAARTATAVAAISGTAPAAPCPETDPAVAAARVAVQAACGCGNDARAFASCMRVELGRLVEAGALAKTCRRTVRRIFRQSICGRTNSVVCCRARRTRQGRIVRHGKRGARCRGGTVCSGVMRDSVGGVFFSSVSDVCSTQSTCKSPPTTITPTTTSTMGLSTTTTQRLPATTVSPPPTPTTVPCSYQLDFHWEAGSGPCGRVSADTAGTQPLIDLTCGDLVLGGGDGTVPPGGPVPEGAVSRFCLHECAGDACTVTGASDATEAVDCTNSSCPFGLPLPIFGSPYVCVLDTLATSPRGSFDLATGSTGDLDIRLHSAVFAVGAYLVNRPDPATPGAFLLLEEPCPVCVDRVDPADYFAHRHPLAGTPTDPRTGVCNGGTRAGEPCTTRNASGLTNDCAPGGATVPPAGESRPCGPAEGCIDAFGFTVLNVGAVPVNLMLTSGATAAAADAAGLFCQHLVPAPTVPGCFNAEVQRKRPDGSARGRACRHIALGGSPFGDVRGFTRKPGRLASVFCVPETAGPEVNLAANLPSAGALTLVGSMELRPVPTITTTAAPITSTTGPPAGG